jgi:hypothetical protein
MNQHIAQKALDPKVAEKALRVIERMEDQAERPVIIRLKEVATPRNVLMGLLAVGLVATIREVDRQRKMVSMVSESNEAIVQYMRVLVDETNCGEEAYTYLQIMAEDEEAMTDWSAEDEEPIPYIPTHETT